MKKLLYSLLLLTCANCMLAMEEETKKMHIFFPLEGGLFTPDIQKAMNQLGWSGSASAVWTGGFSGLWKTVSTQKPDQTKVARRLFELISEIEYGQEKETTKDITCSKVYWQNLKIPPLLVALLQGKKNCEEVHNLVLPYIEQHAGTVEKPSLKSSATIMLIPEKTADIFKPNDKVIALVNELLSKGHKVHIADNWHPETLLALQEKYKEVFDLINGHIMISGHKEVTTMKEAGNCEFHEEFLHKHKEIPHEKCIFIETEKKYAPAFKGKKFNHVMLKNEDVKKLRTSLEKIGLL